jgi:hypothetical protein
VGVFVLGGAALLGGQDDDPGVAANPPAPTAPTETADRAGRPDRPLHHSAGSPSGTVPAAAVTPGPTSGTPAGPAQQPSPEPSHQPTAQPTHEPTHQPSATPIPTPSPTPSPVADPTAVDLRVSAAKVGLGPAAVVTVGWAGLGRGQTGTVTLTADHLAASVSLDPRCDLLGINTATCRLAGDGSLQLVGLGGLLGPTTLTITVAPGPGLHDPSPGDNTTRVVLGP